MRINLLRDPKIFSCYLEGVLRKHIYHKIKKNLNSVLHYVLF